MTVSGSRDLIRRVLGYGGHVEVLAPPALREKVCDELHQAAERYRE